MEPPMPLSPTAYFLAKHPANPQTAWCDLRERDHPEPPREQPPFQLMATRRGRLLDCWYCGHKSDLRHPGTPAFFTCGQCEADNYYDANAEICDPPVASNEAAPRATFPGSFTTRSVSPELSPPEDSLFCNRCLKNQHIVQQALAEYLPPPDHPEYEQYAENYPAVKQDYEERFPLCCDDCEEGVIQRLQATSKAAKEDNLGRILQRSRNVRNRDWRGKDARDALIFLGALMWWAGVLAQLAFSVFAVALCTGRLQSAAATFEPSSTFASQLLQWIFQHFDEQGKAMQEKSWVAEIGVLFGVLSLWWNNKMSEWKHTPGAKFYSLHEYWKLQAVIILARTASRWLLSRPNANWGLTERNLVAAHLFMIVFTVITAIYSLRIVKLIKKRAFTFVSPTDKFLASSTRSKQQQAPPISSLGVLQHQQFPISSLSTGSDAASVKKQYASAYSWPGIDFTQTNDYKTVTPSTASTSYSTASDTSTLVGPDAMDWQPTPRFPHASRPSPLHQRSQPQRLPDAEPERPQGWLGAWPPPDPSRFSTNWQHHAPPPPQKTSDLFKANLPRRPQHPMHRLPLPVFKRKPESERQDFFSNIMNSVQESASRTHAGLSGSQGGMAVDGGAEIQDDRAAAQRRRDFALAPARLDILAPNDDTGLEGLMPALWSSNDRGTERVDKAIEASATPAFGRWHLQETELERRERSRRVEEAAGRALERQRAFWETVKGVAVLLAPFAVLGIVAWCYRNITLV